MNEGIPGWKGPERPVDVVLLMNVLYYTPDRMAVVRQCYSWLKLGGSLLIFHGLYDNTFVRIGKITQLINQPVLSFLSQALLHHALFCSLFFHFFPFLLVFLRPTLVGWLVSKMRVKMQEERKKKQD